MTAARVVLFAGPTLKGPLPEGFELRPPAKQGDIFRVAASRPRVIAIVDGYFEQAPAVWHKEILWALSQGIHVFGAASMGALRAAELHSFGMRGVGEVFESYRAGVTIDDDDVAVLHGPAELGYPLLTAAMVNVRETLRVAQEEAVLSAEAAGTIEGIAKAIFYKERTWERILGDAEGSIDAPSLAAFGAWLPGGEVDLKQRDAQALLRELAAFAAGGPPPFQASFRFEETELWAAAPWQKTGAGAAGAARELDRLVLDEARLADQSFDRLLERALLKVVAAEAPPPAASAVDGAELARAYKAFRARHHLFTRASVDAWLAAAGMTAAALETLLQGQTRVRSLLRGRREAALDAVLDELRLAGGYPALQARARAKQAALGAAAPSGGQAGAPATPQQFLLEWYFQARLGGDLPDDLELYVQDRGFAAVEEFVAVLRREYLFLSATDHEGH